MLATLSTILSLITFSVSALPTSAPQADGGITAGQLLAIAPTSNDCGGASYPDECRTAVQAAPWINQAFAAYGITNIAEQSALISLMAFETADFKYNKNHYPAPGNPGQGTRNMQSLNFNVEYARSIPAIAGQVDQVAGSPNDLLALVLPDEYSFGSAAWFLTTQCPADIRSALQSGTEAGWDSYLSNCVFTPPTDARKAYWTRANSALSQGSQTTSPAQLTAPTGAAAPVVVPGQGSGSSPSQSSVAPAATYVRGFPH